MACGIIWDDDMHLTANPCIVGPLGFKDIWTGSSAHYYLLVLTSFWVQHALWGLDPLPYHLLNIAIHAGCAVLLWRVLRRLRVRGAWFGAALWALHPVQVESVAWITELKNTQSCLFYLLAILFFLKWGAAGGFAGRKGSESAYALALLGAGLAILSKASTVMLPVVLGLCWWWTDGQWRWRNVLRLAPFVLISAAASGWTIWEQQVHFGAVGPEWAQTWPQRVVIAGKVVWFYLGRLMWPHPLIFVYPRWEIDASQPAAYLPALAVAVCLFGLGLARRRLGPLFLAFAYFCVSLFPVLGFFKVYFFRYSFVADHFQYLASIGPLALAAAGISALFGSLEERRSSWDAALCGAVLTALCVLTWRQSRTYESDETLWRATVEGNPGSWMAHNSLGVELERAGKRAEALQEYTEAQRLGPSHAEPYNNLGNALVRSGKADGAVESFTRALRLKRNDPGLHNNLAVALSMNGRWDDAIREYTEAIRLDPNRPETHFSLARALAQVGRRQQAAMHLKQALRLKPDYKQANELLEGLATAAK